MKKGWERKGRGHKQEKEGGRVTANMRLNMARYEEEVYTNKSSVRIRRSCQDQYS